MGEKKKSVVDSIKDRIKNSQGQGPKEGIFYLKDGQKRRVRFISDMEEAESIVMHSLFGSGGYFEPCKKYFGIKCDKCKDDDKEKRDDTYYVWTVYDYESKKRCLFMYKATEKTPVPYMVEYYENNGTICDRDYTISRTGEKLATSYKIVPLDKSKFRKSEDPYDKEDIMEILKENYFKKKDEDDNDDDDEPVKKKKKRDEDEDDDDDEPVKKKKKRDEDDDDEPVKKKKKHAVEYDDDDDEPVRKKKKRVDDDDEDELPKRKKRKEKDELDDDDEDEKPAKKKKKRHDDDDDDYD